MDSQKTKLTQKERILRLLQDKRTVTNYELFDIAFRYPARILELRNDGYVIDSKQVKGSKWQFTYVGTA
jgi:vacuolar-type H+-ATPase subunit D/Vma8